MSRWVGLIGMLLVVVCMEDVTARSVVVDQKDAPIRITEFKAQAREYVDVFQCDVEWTNVGRQPVAGVQFKLIALNLFNEVMRAGSISKDYRRRVVTQGKDKRETWRFGSYREFSEFEVAIVLVYKVRFEDGTIWTYDEQETEAELDREFPELDLPLDTERLDSRSVT